MVFYLPGADYLSRVSGLSLAWYSWDVTYVYYGQLLIATALLLTLSFPVKLPIRKIVGREPSRSEYFSGLALSAFLFLSAIPAAYVIFLPLSLWVPEFVEYWYIYTPPLIYHDYGVYPFVANLLNLVSLCVVAPVVEEIAFRGLILHRWTYRFGVLPAILGSSFVFGIVHPDPLGAFFFGIGMCILYLRTQSLLLPIVCHGAYNFVVWLIELGYILKDGPDQSYTLEQFQNDWPTALIYAALVGLWTVIYLRRAREDIRWGLPGT